LFATVAGDNHARGTGAHDGSNWQRPGDEWGSSLVFSQAGCWRVHAERASEVGDLWLLARS